VCCRGAHVLKPCTSGKGHTHAYVFQISPLTCGTVTQRCFARRRKEEQGVVRSQYRYIDSLATACCVGSSVTGSSKLTLIHTNLFNLAAQQPVCQTFMLLYGNGHVTHQPFDYEAVIIPRVGNNGNPMRRRQTHAHTVEYTFSSFWLRSRATCLLL